MSSEILINVRPQETRVAYVDGGVLTDLKIERKTSPTLVGSIHRGRVIRVLPGMQAAFVDIGLEKAAFLYVGDIRQGVDEGFLEEGEGSLDTPIEGEGENNIPIQDLLHEGQHILVQVAKDPIGTKGARITTHISLPGRFVVYLPTVKHVGISRRIENEETREKLKTLVNSIHPSGGVIVRTAGEDASDESIRQDIEYLDRLSKEILKHYEKKKNVGLIHSEIDVELRALRDLMSESVSVVWVDDQDVHKKVSKFVSQLMPKYKQNIVFYDGPKPLFDLYDIDIEISRSMDRKIWLKSGGYIVIDEAEALVVIDVNTGRYVGKKDLEDTILKTNLEAAKEIAHQLRIRNCGGIIIVDFIDMDREIHREKVLTALDEETAKDKAKTTIISMSSLGLVEMTRKRTRPSLIRTLCEPCTYCEGRGYIKRKSSIANEIFREIEREIPLLSVQKKNIQVHCHSDVIDWIYEMEGETLAQLEQKLNRQLSFKVETSYHVEQYEIFFDD